MFDTNSYHKQRTRRLFLDQPWTCRARQDCRRRMSVRNRAKGDSTIPWVKEQCLGEQDGTEEERSDAVPIKATSGVFSFYTVTMTFETRLSVCSLMFVFPLSIRSAHSSCQTDVSRSTLPILLDTVTGK